MSRATSARDLLHMLLQPRSCFFHKRGREKVLPRSDKAVHNSHCVDSAVRVPNSIRPGGQYCRGGQPAQQPAGTRNARRRRLGAVHRGLRPYGRLQTGDTGLPCVVGDLLELNRQGLGAARLNRSAPRVKGVKDSNPCRLRQPNGDELSRPTEVNNTSRSHLG